MYLTIITSVAYILSVFFIIVFIRAYGGRWSLLAKQWREASERAQERSAFARKVASLVEKGLKEFKFGHMTIWARNQAHANIKHKMALAKLKAVEREKSLNRRKQREGMLRPKSRDRQRIEQRKKATRMPL